ncbi:MAG: 4Fe-4S binding protein [Clostridia bacterium]|nr:4Fe-4S binding protein [Clostridia bacterium]
MKTVYKVEGGCVLCLMCVYQCPVKAISIIEDVSTVIDQDKCIGCGKCYNGCQPEAIIKIEVEDK